MATVTSASWDMSATDRAAKAEIFFARAKALCLDQMLSGASLETVQAMLLMSQYLQGTHRSVMTWNIHGLAVKAAFQLGLHTTASLKSHSPLERELRTRTWYACIILDSNIEYPEHGILPVASKVLQIEHQLLEWQAALPPLLALTTPEEVQSSDEYSLGRRFRVILTVRYHNVRILAHRRMLDLYLASIERGQNYGAEDSMLRQVGQSPVYGDVGVSDQALKETLEQALTCLPMIDKGNKMVDKCAKFTNTLHQCLLLLERSDANDVQGKINGDESVSPTSTPRTVPNGVPYPYVPIPIDASHFDLGALGWDTEGFLSSLNNAGFVDGFQESDLFC
ncbi:hypothetical protein VP1G_08490 [Cytospora mali]|uniref:Xylanolytic transcriptional activator regulatory domain-containing protein n=1 Tax=Cytospora mali TaxID=578113 RepID=A0A194VBD7_CYTMA|nr:hypothetical protein VP1G_08490 [Valsa mali var. pyri (nom. inval.)]